MGFLAAGLFTVALIAAACSSGGSSAPSSGSSAALAPTPTFPLPLTAAPGAAAPAAPRGGLAPDLLLATNEGQFQLARQTGKVRLLYFSFPG